MQVPDWLRALARDARVRQIIVAVVVALLSGGTVALVVDEDGDGPKPPKVILKAPLAEDEKIVSLPDSKAVIVDTDQKVQADEKAHADDPASGVGLHEDAKDETPPGVTKEEVEAGIERGTQIAEDQNTLKPGREVGGAQTVSCQNLPVVNQSSLTSRRFGVILHFTVSEPGSINVIRSLFNTPSFGASSNYGFEPFSLECQRWVPENRKAWAQGAFNSAYVSIEIISNNRTRAEWLDTPMFKTGRLAALVREISIRNGTPLRLVDPVGCVPLAGITDHDRLECGMTHWDVGPGFPWDVFMKQVRSGVASPALTAKERKIVAAVRQPKGTGHSRLYWCRRLSAQIDWLNRSPKVDRRGKRLAIQKRIWRGSCT